MKLLHGRLASRIGVKKPPDKPGHVERFHRIPAKNRLEFLGSRISVHRPAWLAALQRLLGATEDRIGFRRDRSGFRRFDIGFNRSRLLAAPERELFDGTSSDSACLETFVDGQDFLQVRPREEFN